MSRQHYEIRVAGPLPAGASDAFPGMEIDTAPVETVLRGDMIDDAALHGVLELCRVLGLEVTAFGRVHTTP